MIVRFRGAPSGSQPSTNLSTAIATLGLLQSSAAVVIGAMLVSPFLGPIRGIVRSGGTLRSLQHVGRVAAGYLCLLEAPADQACN